MFLWYATLLGAAGLCYGNCDVPCAAVSAL